MGKNTVTKRTVEVRRPDDPNFRAHVDAATYEAVRDALLAALPVDAPGADVHALDIAVGMHVPSSLVGIRKVSAWSERVRLDLEAKGLVVRDAGEPPRWRRVAKP